MVGWDANTDALKYKNTEMKIQEGWLVGMQIQMQIEENLGVVQLGRAVRTSLLDNFASIIRDYCQIKVSLRFKLLFKFAGNISTREDATKLYFSASVQYPISSCPLLLPSNKNEARDV